MLAIAASLLFCEAALAQSRRGIVPGTQSTLSPHEYLEPNTYLVSDNRAFWAMQHQDGNLCVSRGSGPHDDLGRLWCHNANRGSPRGPFHASFVGAGTRLCSLRGGTPGDKSYPGDPTVWCMPKGTLYRLWAVLQNDGNFCVRPAGERDGEVVWCTQAVDIAWGAMRDREREVANSPNAVRPGTTDRMPAYQFLMVGSYLVSANRRFFAMQQRDGNFCVFRGSGPQDSKGALWCHNGRGVPATGSYFTIVTGDGNLCTHRGASPQERQAGPVWCAHAGERPNVGAGSVVVAYDGNLCLYPTNNPAGQATWCSNAVER